MGVPGRGHRGEILHNGMGGVWGERGDRWGDLYGVRDGPPWGHERGGGEFGGGGLCCGGGELGCVN